MAHRAFFLAFLFLGLVVSAINAQTTTDKKSAPPKSSRSKAVKSEESDALQTQQRIVAITLLTALADDSRSFRDQALRARVGARAADAFWETDPEKARELFRRAWEEAEAADAETIRGQAEDMERQRRETGVMVRGGSRDLRGEVLRIVAKRDRTLGEEFLKKLAEAEERRLADAPKADMDPFAAPLEAAKRLQLARRLLDDGEVERAMQFAGPVLTAVNRETIFFLSALREKNATAADRGFLSLVARAQRDPAADANTVSGLSSYAFTPFMYVLFEKEGGSNVSQQRREVPAPDLPANVRQSFMMVAAEILLRPLAPPDQDLTTSGRVGKHLIIKRLLPLFDQYLPDSAPLLRTQMAALSGDLPPHLRTGENNAVTRGIVPEDTSRNPLERMQERLDRAKTADERDAIYADYAVVLSGKGDPKARDLVDKIENSELRKSVRAYIDFQATQQALNNNDALEAARLAKSGELTSPQRIWAYTRAAKILMKTDRTRASELLEEAAAEARRLSGNSADRAKGLVAVASVFMQSDRVRAWETANEALKAANASEGFTGEDSTVSSMLRSKSMVLFTTANAEDFDLPGLFRLLAKEDFNRSVELARNFTGESPRAVATIAIARAVLEKSNVESQALQ